MGRTFLKGATLRSQNVGKSTPKIKQIDRKSQTVQVTVVDVKKIQIDPPVSNRVKESQSMIMKTLKVLFEF